jgi:hypothetical protein
MAGVVWPLAHCLGVFSPYPGDHSLATMGVKFGVNGRWAVVWLSGERPGDNWRSSRRFFPGATLP